MNFLENLDVDVRYPLGGRYFLKRYKYWKGGMGCYVDENGKIETERVFSFIIEHGLKWDNSTSFNVLESKLDTVMDKCDELLNNIKTERKELLTNERAERKLYPQLHVWTFNNVKIYVVSEMSYTQTGYPIIGKKEVNIYGNGMRFQYSECELPKDFEITYEWVMERIVNSTLVRYNNRIKWLKKLKCVTKVIHGKIRNNFLPLHFYIGYCVEVDGKNFNVTDVFDNHYDGFGFKNGYSKVNITIDKLLNLKVVGELQGDEGWVSMLNKVKYCD